MKSPKAEKPRRGHPDFGSRVIGVRVHGDLADKIRMAAKLGRKRESEVLRDLAIRHLP